MTIRKLTKTLWAISYCGIEGYLEKRRDGDEIFWYYKFEHPYGFEQFTRLTIWAAKHTEKQPTYEQAMKQLKVVMFQRAVYLKEQAFEAAKGALLTIERFARVIALDRPDGIPC